MNGCYKTGFYSSTGEEFFFFLRKEISITKIKFLPGIKNKFSIFFHGLKARGNYL